VQLQGTVKAAGAFRKQCFVHSQKISPKQQSILNLLAVLFCQEFHFEKIFKLTDLVEIQNLFSISFCLIFKIFLTSSNLLKLETFLNEI